MSDEGRTSTKNSVGRLIFVGLSVLIQTGWILLLFLRLNQYSAFISLVSSLLAFVVVLRLYGKHTNAAFKMPWIILILTLPIAGLCLYFLWGRSGITHKMLARMDAIDDGLQKKLTQDEAVLTRMQAQLPQLAGNSHYIANFGPYPVYDNTAIDYYSEAPEGLAAQKAALAKAKKFIFMEYHAIQDSEAFGGLKEILAERAAAGVEVRLLYDDVGSVGFINTDFIHRMEQLGIQCRVFNPMIPLLYVFMNNRDHRKITVIDGEIGFTGGYNLADEYFGLTHPLGHWKDTGVRIEGEAVKSLTVMFLEMWNTVRTSDTDYDRYLPSVPPAPAACGFVQPYGDSPLDNEHMGESVYLNLIKAAQTRIWFTTPYLIISDDMNRELSLAAKRGVDVRIITPGIPDKKMIYKVTRSYYAGLVQNGVRIYEYTPGFLHAKMCLCDDAMGAVGTINMDYRSLYLHFENGLLFTCPAEVARLAADFTQSFAVSREVTADYAGQRSAVLRVGQCILRLFSPLM